MRRVRLRPGCHLAVTWGIADQFGGMTAALLHRSRAFVRLGQVEVDVVTFDLRPDYPAVEARLRTTGEFVDGMRLHNLWDWMREHLPPEGPAGATAAPFTPLTDEPNVVSGTRSGREMIRTRLAEDGRTQLQVDHYRADGSLAVSDRRDVRERGVAGGRSIVWCDEKGRPVRRWTSAGLLADRVAALRRNAVRTAASFSDDAVTARWASEIDRAAMERGMVPAAPVRALAFRVRRGAGRRWRRWRPSPEGRPALSE